MASTIHNLPKAPYKKFFGREETMEKIQKTLLRGGTFIASLDGVGGIGKTALAHRFCSKIVLESNRFNYLVWLTAKDTVFDAFSQESQIKRVSVNFRGLETLFDELIKITGFSEEFRETSLDKKQTFFEEIVTTEPIFFVLDNLETINDDAFFKYIFEEFNLFSGENRHLKVLTTSRKRKKIADHPIEIEGLSKRRALDMLYYFAEHLARKPVLDILNATENDNIRLVERLGCVPLLIEFAVAQLSNGRKTRGQIYEELQGFPSINSVSDGEERKNIISDIITFQFQNMYESLSKEHTTVLQNIVAWINNPTGDLERDALTFEKLMSFAGSFPRGQLENLLEDLMDHKFISVNENNTYRVNMMAINFVKRKYETFHTVENAVVAFKNRIIRSERLKKDTIDTTLEHIEEQYIEKGDYKGAEVQLSRQLDFREDARIHHKLAEVQVFQHDYERAFYNFEKATRLNEKAVQPWLDWIAMERSRGANRREIAILNAEKGLIKTGKNIAIVLLLIDLYEEDERLKDMRELAALCRKEFSIAPHRTEDLKQLLLHCAQIEKNQSDLNSDGNQYLENIKKLISLEKDAYQRLEYLREKLAICREMKWFDESRKTQEAILNLEARVMKDLPKQAKQMNHLYYNEKKYEEAVHEAKHILSWCTLGKYDEKDLAPFQAAFRVLFEVHQKKNEPEKILLLFEEYEHICQTDSACVRLHNNAKEAFEQKRKEELIEKINTNIQLAELQIRDLIMFALDQNDDSLEEYLHEKGKAEWIARWKLTRRKAQGGSSSLIHYSDFGQAALMLKDLKKKLVAKLLPNREAEAEEVIQLKKKLSNINQVLHEYILKARNSAFHSRLPLNSLGELNEIFVDVNRLNRLIDQVKAVK